jgi:hypothetical protein
MITKASGYAYIYIRHTEKFGWRYKVAFHSYKYGKKHSYGGGTFPYTDEGLIEAMQCLEAKKVEAKKYLKKVKWSGNDKG